MDGVPEVAGSGIVALSGGKVFRLRDQGTSGATVVFEFRRMASADESFDRDAGKSPSMEWTSLGFNCGGAVLAWIGVAGASSLAGVTGGLSLLGAGVLYGGALATTGQCLASGYRVWNVEHGRSDINDQLDRNKIYTRTMLAADGIGLLGAGGALKEVLEVNAVLKETRVGWSAGLASSLSRPMRRRLTTALELEGGKRASNVVITKLLRQRILDATAGALAMGWSGVDGIAKEVVVWITSEAAAINDK